MKTSTRLTGMYQALYDHYGPQRWWPGETPFEVAVGAVLTQNTNWTNVEKAIGNLKAEAALSARAIYRMQPGDLARLIRPAGYYNVKAARLKSFVSFVMESYGGSMKRMSHDDAGPLREKLLAVHGIGEETADSILLYALDKPVFVIDAYTKRVLSRHGLLDQKATYSQCQDLFHRGLRKDRALFNEYHALFVRVCKEQCRPTPRCEGCPLQQ